MAKLKEAIMSKRSKIKALFSVLMVLTVALSAIALPGCQKKPEEIKIGAVLPLTGKMASFGEWEQRALLLAEERINEQKMLGKTKIKFILEDSKADPKEAVAAVNKLINVDKVKILFVLKSTLVEAVEPITDEAKVLLFAFAMDPELGRSPYTFRIYPNMRQQNSVMVDYLQRNDAERTAVLYVQTPATEFLVPELLVPGLNEMGKSVVAVESFAGDDKDIRTQVTKIKASDPEIVITQAHHVFLPNILTAFKEMGLLDKVTIVGGLEYTFPIKVSPELLDGIHFVSPTYALEQIDSARATWFEKKCLEKYGEYPGYDPAFFFDAAMIVAGGVKRHGTDVEKLSDYFLTVRDYEGVTGPITIEENHNAQVEMMMGVFRNGERVPAEN